MSRKAMLRAFDKNGQEIKVGMVIRDEMNHLYKVYKHENELALLDNETGEFWPLCWNFDTKEFELAKG